MLYMQTIYAHDDLWPLIYTGRCKCVPTTYQTTVFLGSARVVGRAETRSIDAIVYRTTVTTAAGLLPQDAADAGFMGVHELHDYLRKQGGVEDLRPEHVVVLAYFERQR